MTENFTLNAAAMAHYYDGVNAGVIDENTDWIIKTVQEKEVVSFSSPQGTFTFDIYDVVEKTHSTPTYEKVWSAVTAAMKISENKKADGSINWSYVDADAFFMVNPKNEQVDVFYTHLDQVVHNFNQS